MNERIRQLADEAYDEYETDTKKYGANIPDEFCQKFAQLIVQECALQCNHNDDMDRILEHFGVEE